MELFWAVCFQQAVPLSAVTWPTAFLFSGRFEHCFSCLGLFLLFSLTQAVPLSAVTLPTAFFSAVLSTF